MSPPERRLVLASASPRREDLLRQLGVSFEVLPSDVAEQWPPGTPREAVTGLALAKARSVRGRVGTAVVLGADTAVVLEGQVFGKPRDPEDARGMLRQLRGREHEVITGVALVEAPAGREAATAVVSRVRMRAYDEAEMEAYIASGEPFDKAGAYAVQGAGSALVAAVQGCYTNVVGLPLTTTRRLLEAWGVISSRGSS
ncbi:MAG: septum formation protein Maf [Candidatus Rokubacteria bacterium]|nr:septum formation protein Maf [Candidatus Rokubacteria bacterium]